MPKHSQTSAQNAIHDETVTVTLTKQKKAQEILTNNQKNRKNCIFFLFNSVMR